MRVLWFIEKPLPLVTRRLGESDIHHGSWLDQYEIALRDTRDIALGIAAPCECAFEPFVTRGVTYYGLPSGHSNGCKRVAERWRRLARPDMNLDQCREVIERFQPDLVHVHGTERQFGLLAGQSPVPVVTSIQGLLTVYDLMGARGRDMSLLLSLSPSLFLRGMGALLDPIALKAAAERERRSIRLGRHFIGRTRWDADVVRVLNPGAHYYHCDELLRPEFSQSVWDQDRCVPNTVYSIAGGYTRKGLGTLFRAVALLRERACPGIRLRITGASRNLEERRAAAREIGRLELSSCVSVQGTQDAAGLVQELLGAAVFALPSHADNSPNTLAEAMMVGTPCVASAVGGVPSMARDSVEALLVQDGDPYALAGAILRLLEDRDLARGLSLQARATARCRHDPETVRRTLVNIYHTVLERESAPASSRWR